MFLLLSNNNVVPPALKQLFPPALNNVVPPGLTPAQCERLIEKHHIYLLKSGRISLAGLNKNNIAYVVDAIDDVVKNA